MPITFKVSTTRSEPVTKPLRFNQDPDLPENHYLNDCIEYKKEKCGQIVHESEWIPQISEASKNGFVYAVTQAYNNHHKLVLRPDDVWIAITTQFSAYINGNAEAFRDVFVSHKDKKSIVVHQNGILDYASFARQMSHELKNHIKRPDVIDWIIPRFSTTTPTDVVVGSVVAMSSMKTYFNYIFYTLCGIPEVTLLGSPDDWRKIHRRISFLNDYGPVCQQWAKTLDYVTMNFYKSSMGDVDVNFWQRVCSFKYANGSGSNILSGWITAFCAFSDEGKWQGNTVATQCIPIGYATVPVRVEGVIQFEALMFAGHMSYKHARSSDGVIDKTSISPQASWAMVRKNVI